MGLIQQLIRGIKSRIKNGFDFVFRRKKKQILRDVPVTVPRSWSKKIGQKTKPAPRVISHRLRVPHLLTIKRMLAAFLLLVNFVFSQFLLGSVGTGAQPMFILFLLNSFILIDYLWKTRRAPE
jgi:hypothetical protein